MRRWRGLDYPTAGAVWLAAGLVCLFGAVYLLMHAEGVGSRPWTSVVLSAATMAWYPVLSELSNGQVMLLMLLLLAAARLALRRERSALGGALLGTTALVKPVLLPLILLLALRRDWRALGASAATVGLGYGIAGSVIGLGALTSYVTRVLPAVNEIYQLETRNISLWTIGWRLFHGTAAVRPAGFSVPPLLDLPPAAGLVAVLLPAAALVLATWWVCRNAQRDAATGVLVCVSILVSPIAWDYYLVLLALPIAQVIAWLARHDFPRRETRAALIVLALLAVDWPMLVWRLARGAAGSGDTFTVPFVPAQLTFAPAAAVVALGTLLALLASRERA